MKCLIFEEFRVTYVPKIKESDHRDRDIDFISVNSILLRLFYLASEKLSSSTLTSLISKIFLGRLDLQKVSVVIEVDRKGLLVTNQAGLKFKIPKVLLSYEIFFKKETSKKFKKLEILASNNTNLWLVRDEIRMQCLLKDNVLDIENCLILPKGFKGSGAKKIEKMYAIKW